MTRACVRVAADRSQAELGPLYEQLLATATGAGLDLGDLADQLKVKLGLQDSSDEEDSSDEKDSSDEEDSSDVEDDDGLPKLLRVTKQHCDEEYGTDHFPARREQWEELLVEVSSLSAESIELLIDALDDAKEFCDAQNMTDGHYEAIHGDFYDWSEHLFYGDAEQEKLTSCCFAWAKVYFKYY